MKRFDKNESRTLQAMFFQHHPTRASIARKTGLSLVKISSILVSLEDKGYIVKIGKTRTTGGRPAYIYQLKPSFGLAIGVSLERDRFHIVAIDGGKNLEIDETHPLSLPLEPGKHVDAILAQVSAVVNKTIGSAGGRRSVVSVGIALPGMVDSQRGIWLLGLQVTGITHIPLASMFEEQLRMPVYIEDASRTLTILEMHRNSKKGKKIRNLVLVYVGLGLGTGIVINGRIYRGYHGLAGEIGHVEHADNTYRCSCNNVGCLETVVSAEGILRVFGDRLKEGVRSRLQKTATDSGAGLSLNEILAAAEGGDRLAQSTLGEIGVFLGDGCATLIKLFNPQRLIISGPGSIFKEYFRDPVQQVIQQRVLPEMLDDYQTVFAEYQANHEAWGAALLAMGKYLNSLTRHPSNGDS